MAAVDQSRPAAAPPSAPPAGDDWPAQAADTIVNVVGTVRDRTTGTAITGARAVVYGLLATILGTTALVLLSVLLVRVLVILFGELLDAVGLEHAGRQVWMAELTVGVLFGLLGLVTWKRAVRAAHQQ